MPTARIEFRHGPRDRWTLYAIREGSRREIQQSADALLSDLRDRFPHPSVRVDGHIIRKPETTQ